MQPNFNLDLDNQFDLPKVKKISSKDIKMKKSMKKLTSFDKIINFTTTFMNNQNVQEREKMMNNWF